MTGAGSVAPTGAPVPALAHSIPDTAAMLGVGKVTTYRLIKEGKLRAVKIGARTVIPRQEIDRLLGLDSTIA